MSIFVLKAGVALGVDTPPLRSASLSPTKEELKGRTSRGRKTFLAEKGMDLVIGPFKATEATSCPQCHISELCPGPLTATDEGDKVRTVLT